MQLTHTERPRDAHFQLKTDQLLHSTLGVPSSTLSRPSDRNAATEKLLIHAQNNYILETEWLVV